MVLNKRQNTVFIDLLTTSPAAAVISWARRKPMPMIAYRTGRRRRAGTHRRHLGTVLRRRKTLNALGRNQRPDGAIRQALNSVRISEVEIQRHSSHVPVGRLAGSAVLSLVVCLHHQKALIRPLDARRVPFCVPRMLRPVI